VSTTFLAGSFVESQHNGIWALLVTFALMNVYTNFDVSASFCYTGQMDGQDLVLQPVRTAMQ